MRVVIIGAGNVASVLGRLIKKAGHEIIQVISRNMDTAQILADELHCSATNNFADLDKTANIYIVAMSDAALNDLKENINVGDKVIVHTAGSVSKEVLKNISVNYGVLYPLQSLRKENTDPHLHIPVFIDALEQGCSASCRARDLIHQQHRALWVVVLSRPCAAHQHFGQANRLFYLSVLIDGLPGDAF